MQSTTTVKTCGRCGVERALDAFGKDGTRRDGRHPYCRECRQCYQRKYETESPKRQAYKAAWLAANPNRQQGYQRTYRARHPDRLRDSRIRRRSAAAAYSRLWRERNRERYLRYMREYERMKRARIRASLVIRFSQEQLAQRLSMFVGCWLCGGEPKQVDHVKPIAKGGAHILANLRPICVPCNSWKRAKWPFNRQAFRPPEGGAAN